MQAKYSDDDEKKEWDYQMPELTVKYVLSVLYEKNILKKIESSRKHYEYEKLLENDYLENIVDIYEFSEESQKFQYKEESRYTSFG